MLLLNEITAALPYADYLTTIKRDLEAQVESGKPLDASTVTAGLLPKENNKALRSWAAKNGVPVKDFDAALRNHQIVARFGAIPTTPEHLLELVLARDTIHCRFNGLLEQTPKPRISNGTKLIDVSESDLSDPLVATLTSFTSPKTLTLNDLALDLRTANANLKLGFSDTAIRDAVDKWMRDARRERLAAIYMTIQHSGLRPYEKDRASALWTDFASKVFQTDKLSPEFVAAVLRKFIWSVKRKMLGLPVTNHIMIVLMGPQGIGKTVFVRKLIGPVVELSLEVDFATLEESRNIEIWRYFVHFLDEMGYATKADCETIKRVITTDTLSRRPMGSNSVETIAQCATMIGCSNKELEQLINDSTGNRRFAPLRYRSDADRNMVNSTDYLLLWRSVDEHGADPMIDHMETLGRLQSASRQLGPVEQWLVAFDQSAPATMQVGEKMKVETLYERYRIWEQSYRPGSRPMDLEVWRAELNRLLKNDKGVSKLPFRRGEQRASYGFPLVFQAHCGSEAR